MSAALRRSDKRLELSEKCYIWKRSWPHCTALAFPDYPCPVPGNAALEVLGVLGVHAPVIRCSLLSVQGQWSEILGALLLLERADSLLMLIGTQQEANDVCVCVCVCVYVCSTAH